jgi:hypothetical protein
MAGRQIQTPFPENLSFLKTLSAAETLVFSTEAG